MNNKTGAAPDHLAKGEYENRVFTNRSFLQADLADMVFVECEFDNCDLSMARLTNATLTDVSFKNCKLLGLRFDTCNPFCFSVIFEQCNLNHASFYGVKLQEKTFSDLKLHDADFSEADLTGSVFDNCDFAGATFDHTVLEKADFRSSFNYSIDPERNRIRKARFSLPGVPGLLHRYDITIEP